MRKSDLRSGMIVEKRKGGRGIVFLGTSYGNIIGGLGGVYNGEGTTWMPLDSLNEDLTYPSAPESDIVKIYQPTCNMHYGTLNLAQCNLIWERKDIIELSFEEIAEKLGIDPELLKIIKK